MEKLFREIRDCCWIRQERVYWLGYRPRLWISTVAVYWYLARVYAGWYYSRQHIARTCSSICLSLARTPHSLTLSPNSIPTFPPGTPFAPSPTYTPHSPRCAPQSAL